MLQYVHQAQSYWAARKQIVSIEALKPERHTEAAATLVRAFEHDPIHRYILPDSERRIARLTWMMRQGIRDLAPRGAGWISGDGKGVALWLPPKPRPRRLSDTMGALNWLAGFAVMGLGASYRGLEVYRDVLRRERAEIKSPHWVLEVLGVDPAHQGCGAASALLQPIFEIADHDGTPCYLITHNPKNVPFYEGRGFQVLSQGEVTKQRLFVCSLRRPSRNDLDSDRGTKPLG